MKFRLRPLDEPELNLIPMIDVLLMTLIFLVVTTSFSKEAQLQIKLPESSAEAKIDDTSLRIAIDAKGHYFINNKQLLNETFEVLQRTMLEAAGTKRDPMVVIYADAKTPHQAVVRVMDAARRLGYTHLTFATQQYSSDSASP